MLAEYQAHELEFADSAAWRDRVWRWLAVAPNPASRSAVARTSAKLALLEGRTAAAEALLTESVGDIVSISDTGRRVECAALHLHLRMQRGDASLPVQLVADFAATFEVVKTLGEQDYPALVGFALTARTDASEAQAKLVEYVENARREAGPPSRMLLAILDQPDSVRLGASVGNVVR